MQDIHFDIAPAAAALTAAGYVQVADGQQQASVIEAIERGVHYSETRGHQMQADEASDLLLRRKSLRYGCLLEGVAPEAAEVAERAASAAAYEETIVLGEAGMWVRVEDAEWFLAALWPALNDCLGLHRKEWSIDRADRAVLGTRDADSSLWAAEFKAAEREFVASAPVLSAAAARAASVVKAVVAERRRAAEAANPGVDETLDFEKLFTEAA